MTRPVIASGVKTSAVVSYRCSAGCILFSMTSATPSPASAAPPVPPANLSRSERLENLPYTRKHTSLLFASGTGWALDAMDIGLISFIMVALIAEWDLSPVQQSAIVSTGFIGMAVGASLAGLLADRFGRRQVFALTLVIYGLATGASALVTGVGALLILRFIVGLGLGGELPVASTLVSEFAPRAIRGRVVVALESFWAVGWLAAATIGYLVVPLDNGWRWALALGMIPAAWSVVIRFGVPESVRFLESRGRHAEAEKIVSAWEDAAGVRYEGSRQATDAPSGPPIRRRDLFGAQYRRATVGLWMIWFGINFAYYGAFLWLPTILYSSGLTMVRSFEYTLIITLAQLPGYLVAAILIERWGRRATLISFLGGSAAAALAFGMAQPIADGLGLSYYTVVIITGCVLSFFNLGAWGAVYALTPEVYPTEIRATGSGAATAFGRVAAIAAPIIVPLLSPAGPMVLFILFGVMFLVAMCGGLLIPESRGRALA